MSKSEHTHDVISNLLTLRQSRKGYRFGLDALLLATDLPELEDGAVVYELGAGQGAVSLSISARQRTWEVVALERQPELFAHLEANIASNREHLGEIDARLSDIRAHREQVSAHVADLVVCNPPYFPEGARRASGNAQRAGAHIELHGGLRDFLEAACYISKHRGWIEILLPPFRLLDLARALEGLDMKLASIRHVHADPTRDAYLMECRLRRGGAPDLTVRRPLMVRGEDGFYTDEVTRRVAGAAVEDPDEELLRYTRARSHSGRGSET